MVWREVLGEAMLQQCLCVSKVGCCLDGENDWLYAERCCFSYKCSPQFASSITAICSLLYTSFVWLLCSPCSQTLLFQWKGWLWLCNATACPLWASASLHGSNQRLCNDQCLIEAALPSCLLLPSHPNHRTPSQNVELVNEDNLWRDLVKLCTIVVCVFMPLGLVHLQLCSIKWVF